jgi:hypothetical protein
MIEHLPIFISVLFILTTFLTLILVNLALKKANIKNRSAIIIGLLIWLGIQLALSISDVYSNDTQVMPPKIALFAVLPAFILIGLLLVSKKGKVFISQLSSQYLTLISIVRIPVELTLFFLFTNAVIPQIMTFEGNNFDILAGITAPLIYYFGFVTKKINQKIVLLWNCLSLALLVNIIIVAFLSAPSPLQKFGFEQPNIAILHFPFAWLPAFIVPMVLISHIASIKSILKNKKYSLTKNKLS